jgi:hypothetical protein
MHTKYTTKITFFAKCKQKNKSLHNKSLIRSRDCLRQTNEIYWKFHSSTICPLYSLSWNTLVSVSFPTRFADKVWSASSLPILLAPHKFFHLLGCMLSYNSSLFCDHDRKIYWNRWLFLDKVAWFLSRPCITLGSKNHVPSSGQTLPYPFGFHQTSAYIWSFVLWRAIVIIFIVVLRDNHLCVAEHIQLAVQVSWIVVVHQQNISFLSSITYLFYLLTLWSTYKSSGRVSIQPNSTDSWKTPPKSD